MNAMTYIVHLYGSVFRSWSCIVGYSTLYCFPIVIVRYIVNGEIQRPGSSITICCVKFWWRSCQVFTFTVLDKEKGDICSIIAISYCSPVRINTTVECLPLVPGYIYCRVRF